MQFHLRSWSDENLISNELIVGASSREPWVIAYLIVEVLYSACQH